jgi:hypothetical protein
MHALFCESKLHVKTELGAIQELQKFGRSLPPLYIFDQACLVVTFSNVTS